MRKDLVFGDSFTGGTPQLPWEPYPTFNQDSLQGTVDASSPSAEKGVGVLDNDKVGGFAALSYVAREVPSDFYLEAWLHFSVEEGQSAPRNGLAFRVDPRGGQFYRVASHFAADPSLTLVYVGRDNFPVYLARWKEADLPGGIPTVSGWHRLAIEVVDGAAEVYWDGGRLPRGPFPVDRVPSGFVGVYATRVGGLGRVETRVSDFRVWRL